jgi:pimeloyl-ACP methyl ester carboxylesterase
VAEHRYPDGWYRVADGLRLHYRDYPGSSDRPPLICLAGLTRNARDFEAFAERYSPRFRVLALDFRGRSLSDFDPQPLRYNPLTYVGDVLQLLDQLGVPRAIFVGTSLGGIVTMLLAATAPQRVAGAILNDVGPELSDAGLDRIRGYVGKGECFADWDEAAQALAAINRGIPRNFTQADWIKAAHRACREEDGAIVFDYDPAIAVPFAAVAAAPAVDMWPLFHALALHPLLALRGEVSDLLSAEAFERMRVAAPNARFAVIPGVGHAPMLDEPAAVAAIDQFLDGFDS